MSFELSKDFTLENLVGFFRSYSGPAVIIDSEKSDSPIDFVNPAFLRMTGFQEEELIDANWKRFLRASSGDELFNDFVSAVRGPNSARCEVLISAKNSSPIRTACNSFPIFNKVGLVTKTLIVAKEPSTVREAVFDLKEAVAAVENSADIYLKIAYDGKILSANKAAGVIFGWEPGNLVGKHARCLVPKRRQDVVRTNFFMATLGSARLSIDGEFLRKDGSSVFVEWTGAKSEQGQSLICVGRDVTDRKAAELGVVRANSRVTSILSSITEGCLSLDRNWVCTYINAQGAQWLNRTPEDLIGRNLWAEFKEAVGGPFYHAFHAAMANDQPEKCEAFYTPVSKWIEARAYPSSEGLTVVFTDISERKKRDEELIYSSNFDMLTGLLNRKSCIGALESYLRGPIEDRKPLGVIFVDLDHFKEINDAYGHNVGDHVLKIIGTRLGAYNSDSCLAARISGDEFVILLTDTSQEDAVEFSRKVLGSIVEEIIIDGIELRVGASIGVTIADHSAKSADDLIIRADSAMYLSKSNGRQTVTAFTSEVDTWFGRRLRLRQDLLQAVATGQFELYYQPQVSLSENKIVGVEALVRWNHPDYGFLEPAAFVELAEESSNIIALGGWVFNEACRQLALWNEAGVHIKMSINVSGRQLGDKSLLSMMSECVARHGVNPTSIKLEVTESMLAQDFDIASAVLEGLRDMGFHIALDDFGTGYSNLAYINRLPVSTIKIDRSFVVGIGSDARALPLINAIIAMAKSLDLTVVCEGIETAEQRRQLEATGCDSIQGYLVGHPLPAHEFAKNYANQEEFIVNIIR